MNGEKYSVTITEDGIFLKKAAKFDWNELRKTREAVNDPHPLTTEEICEIVREVRRENNQLGKQKIFCTNIKFSKLIS